MPAGEVFRTVYRDAVCSVLINRLPVEKGHLLVVSKKHYSDMLSAPDPVVAHMFRVAKRFGRLEMRKLECFGMDIGANIGGMSSVHHFHVHVLPRYSSRLIHFAYPVRDEIRAKEMMELKQLLKI
jgi:histidine triad (HIT) family protein